jgi:hypothetical protein
MARNSALQPAFDQLLRAQAQLVQAQALLEHNHAVYLSQREEDRKRIERQLEAIMALLMKHEEILQKLPDVIKEKIGFKN